MLSADRLKQVFNYNPDTGAWTVLLAVKKRPLGPARLKFGGRGYPQLWVDGRNYYCHRLAWLYMTGEWPPPGSEIDHIDLDKMNCRWANLRLASRTQNAANCPSRSHNQSGFKGVSQHRNKWRATMTVGRKHRHLGYFSNPQEAADAYARAAAERYGEFGRGQ